MDLTLSPEETRALRHLLDVALSELHSEIHHTDSAEYRDNLRQREQALRDVRDKLGTTEPTP